MADKSEKETIAEIARLNTECSALRLQLATRGKFVDAVGTFRDDIVRSLEILQGHHADLTRQLSETAVSTPAPVVAAPVAVAAEAPLSAEELRTLKAISWTLLVQLSGNKIKNSEARAIIAEKAGRGKSAQPNLTAKVLANHGVKSLAELRALKAANHDPASE